MGTVGTFFSNLAAAPPDFGAEIPAFLLAFLTGEFSIGLPDLVVLATGKVSACNTTGSTLFPAAPPNLSFSGLCRSELCLAATTGAFLAFFLDPDGFYGEVFLLPSFY